MTDPIYDLVIVGGGVVGASLALALTDANLKIALIDQRVPHHADKRLFALSLGSCQLLAHIGVWDALHPDATAIHHVHVSQQKRFGAIRLSRETVNVDALGFVIPAYRIEEALHAALLQQANLTLYQPAVLETLNLTPTHVHLTLKKDGDLIHLQADRVIGADGTHSKVRAALAIATTTHDYEQSALVTQTKLTRHHQHIAYERFLSEEKGEAIAMLPLANNECATIWSASQHKIELLMTLSDEAFTQKLQHEFGYRLGRLHVCAPRFVYPLQMVRAEKAFVDRVMLIGSAAHTFHPIAAQGFNLALYEVAAIAEGLKTHQSFQSIDDAIRAQMKLSVQLSHGIATIFANRSSMISTTLQLGMIGFELATPLKKELMMRMVGKHKHAPALLRAKRDDYFF